MSRRRKNKLNYTPRGHNQKKETNWSQAQMILDQILACNTSCKHGFCLVDHKNENAEIEWMIQNLPTLPYVMDSYLNFVFSNKLTTGDSELDQKVLNPFLYRLNAKGVTNHSVLREAVKNTLLYGKCGIRWLDEEQGIVSVKSNRYTSLITADEQFYGFDRIVAYAVSMDEQESVSLGQKPIELDKQTFFDTGQLISRDKDTIILLPQDFINLRTDTSTENGISKLTEDKQRLELLGSVYQRLNYDIVYDGPGRLIFWMKDNFLDGGDIDLSANEILDQTQASKDLRATKAKEEIRKMAEDIKNSSSDNVILASSYFDNMEHIPRVTKATEFMEYLQQKEGSIIAQCIGITPELLGLGDVSGNVSMEKIIDNAMVNMIIPLREALATQISPMLSAKLGIPKVYFDKYEAQYSVDKSSENYKYSLSVQQLVTALNSSSQEGSNVSEESVEKITTALNAILDHIIAQA